MDANQAAAAISLPALLRAARRPFGMTMRAELARAGHDDIPGNGLFVIGAIAKGGAPLAGIIGHLGVSKQAAGQLIDTLVVRGYLQRSVDPDDRRRLTIHLSERGRAAAAILRKVSEDLEAQLVRQVGAGAVATTRATLLALVGLTAADGAEPGPPPEGSASR